MGLFILGSSASASAHCSLRKHDAVGAEFLPFFVFDKCDTLLIHYAYAHHKKTP